MAADGLSLPVWLRQQIQTDRQLALAAQGHGDGAWTATRGQDGYLHNDGPHLSTGDPDPWVKRINTGVWLCDDPDDDCESMRGAWMAQAEHAARWDPVAVLADLDARLALVREHSGRAGDDHLCPSEIVGYSVQSWHDDADPCPTLRVLAAPYAGRDGWDGTWAL